MKDETIAESLSGHYSESLARLYGRVAPRVSTLVWRRVGGPAMRAVGDGVDALLFEHFSRIEVSRERD